MKGSKAFIIRFQVRASANSAALNFTVAIPFCLMAFGHSLDIKDCRRNRELRVSVGVRS